MPRNSRLVPRQLGCHSSQQRRRHGEQARPRRSAIRPPESPTRRRDSLARAGPRSHHLAEPEKNVEWQLTVGIAKVGRARSPSPLNTPLLSVRSSGRCRASAATSSRKEGDHTKSPGWQLEIGNPGVKVRKFAQPGDGRPHRGHVGHRRFIRLSGLNASGRCVAVHPRPGLIKRCRASCAASGP